MPSAMFLSRLGNSQFSNLLNVVGQIFLLDRFVGGAFRNYGAAFAAFSHIPKMPKNIEDFEQVKPMDKYFPKLTKCWLRNYGPSGTIQLNYLCVLPLNIVNEKLFVILWFWLVFLAFVSFLALFFHLLVFCLPPLCTFLIMGQLRHVRRGIVSKIINRFGFGDWFLLYSLGKNVNPLIYKDLITKLARVSHHKEIVV